MHKFSLLCKAVVLALGSGAAALKRDLRIVNAQLAPDGFSRSTTVAEGQFPGPLLTGTKGEHFQINVVNELHDSTMLKSTSIHWHGFFQHGTNWADGPSFVNQCPIAANHSFLYDFHAEDQTGTYWYHSHLETQYCDGLRGPIVVYDPQDPLQHLYDIDDETTVLTLADWYHQPSPQLNGQIPNPLSTLINGLGRFGTNSTSPLAIVNVQHGKRYRFRLLNIACDPNYVFSIDGHTMTIIEADGIETQPLPVDSLQIFAAQRYSFILTANQPVANYWIRANPDTGTPGFVGGMNSAILRYAGAPNAEPTSKQGLSVLPFNEVNLHPLEPTVVPGGNALGAVDFAKNLNLTFNGTAFFVDNTTFIPPSVPILLQVLSGTQDPRDLLPEGSVIPLPHNSSIEISIPGGIIGGGHPFHLHGHAFDVVRSANSTTYNFENPVRRDVVNIGVLGDNVTIRFQTDNPGPWFLHCHIDWHLQAGLAVVFAEDIPNIKSANPVPAAWNQLCPIYDSLTPDQL